MPMLPEPDQALDHRLLFGLHTADRARYPAL
jgi:hypothetical protein